jgi:hypothetical protein
MLKNLSKPMQYGLVFVLAVAAWLILSPALFPESGNKSIATKIKKSAKTTADLYTPEDYKAKFAPESSVLKNAFKPLVVKTTTGGKGAAAKPNLVPAAFAAGDPNWSYTGTAEVDGVLQALLENRTTGESAFLRVGDTWKGISVEEITEDSLVIASSDGDQLTLKLPTEDEVLPAAGPRGFTPAQPGAGALQGAIGPMSVQPDGTMPDQMNAAPNQPGGNGFGRRGRRGNRGGGGGNGFGQ